MHLHTNVRLSAGVCSEAATLCLTHDIKHRTQPVCMHCTHTQYHHKVGVVGLCDSRFNVAHIYDQSTYLSNLPVQHFQLTHSDFGNSPFHPEDSLHEAHIMNCYHGAHFLQIVHSDHCVTAPTNILYSMRCPSTSEEGTAGRPLTPM